MWRISPAVPLLWSWHVCQLQYQGGFLAPEDKNAPMQAQNETRFPAASPGCGTNAVAAFTQGRYLAPTREKNEMEDCLTQSGGPSGTRTRDRAVMSRLLYQLS